MMKSKKQTNSANSRSTIGYFAASVGGFSQFVWSGAVDMARKKDVNLICFEGAILREPTFWGQANIIYDLATVNNIDGVISWASMLGDFFTIDELETFHERYRSVPLVTMGKLLKRFPGILMDSYNGMREAVSHLIETHGYRRLAFIRGPEDHIYAQERYRAYVETLKAYDIPLNPRLVTPPATWSYPEGRATGVEAIRLLLDERGLRPQTDLEAVVGASEFILLSAVESLQARGINIPGQVAVVGFDDTILGQTNIPPITSVAPPFYRTGSQAVEILLTLMEGGQVPHETIVPSKLVVRQSCGCLLPVVAQVETDPLEVKDEALETVLAAQRVEIISEMKKRIENPAEHITGDWAERLLQSVIAELQGKSHGIFLRELDGILRQEIPGTGDITVWQGVVSVLRQKTLPYLQGKELQHAISLWEQARVVIGEAARQQQSYQNLQVDQQAQTLREIGAMLITMFDVGGLMDILAEKLPNLDIPSCYLVLYENPQPYEYPQPAPEWSRLVLAYTEKGRVELEPEGNRFRSHDLLPQGMWPKERQVSFVVEPLFFQKNQLGFALFEIGPYEATVYQTLRMQISSALQGALLVQRVQERSAELTRQQYILNTFMENVPGSIYFKDIESRFTQINKALALNFGLDDPAEAVGKSDYDFFPEKQARHKYEQEQEIIHTGQPILNQEEPDGIGRWALTTKMPLRDENGKIIGTFGISHDITEMKRAQAALVRQERLSTLGQLTATVAHEIRNPLGTIRASAYSIDQKTRSKGLGVERALDRIQRNITRCDNIIGELLDFTRMRGLSLQQINFDQWIQGVLDEQKLPDRITPRYVLNADTLVSLDPERFRRVIINLLDNACQAILEQSKPEGEEEKLIVRSEIVESEIKLSIIDTGPGIPPEVISQIFEPLFSTKNFGVGLGLAVVREIIRQHKGRIEVSSEVGVGTQMMVWLPLAEHG